MDDFGRLPPEAGLFVNLHPVDLLDDRLLDPASAFSAAAGRITLEVTERIPLDRLADLAAFVGRLNPSASPAS
jgi:EAL domain-containing protein (putative c-di-GMP-specific phosphodiesterase class I)